MNNQNQYGELQLCIRCKQPLEKARVGSFKGRGVCNVCKKKRIKDRIDSKLLKE